MTSEEPKKQVTTKKERRPRSSRKTCETPKGDGPPRKTQPTSSGAVNINKLVGSIGPLGDGDDLIKELNEKHQYGTTKAKITPEIS